MLWMKSIEIIMCGNDLLPVYVNKTSQWKSVGYQWTSRHNMYLIFSMLVRVHQDGDHHQQRREILIIFICNWKMDGRNIQILPNFSLTNCRSVSQSGQGRKRAKKMVTKLYTKFIVMDRRQSTHLQVTDEDSLCWRKLSSLSVMEIVTWCLS